MSYEMPQFKIIFRVLLALELFILILSFVMPSLPGWSMFSKIDNPTYVLADKKNNIVDSKLYLPPVTYVFSEAIILDLARFICIKKNEYLSLRFSNGVTYSYESPACVAKKN